tara:strand:- start:167 stop:478 length:312 start_codon:yes stop_codon:yes gene_type:complete
VQNLSINGIIIKPTNQGETMGYNNNNIIRTLGVDDESKDRKLGITVAVDCSSMCTISFGTSYSIRIPEDDVHALRDVLHEALIEQQHNRYRKAGLIETVTPAK